jgi:subtilisin family serine protease
MTSNVTGGSARTAGRAAFAALVLTTGVSLLGAATPAAAAPPQKTAVIVQLKPGADPDAESRRASNNGASIRHLYREVFPGFAGEFPPQALAGLRNNPRVELIETDAVATTSAINQSSATWGLDRVDQRTLPLTGTFSYANAAGTGVTAYIIDTGIAAHPDFGTRLGSGYTAITDATDTGDCNGHGTHVAGTVASTTYGVAKAAQLVPVRVLGCDGSGSWSGVIAGLDWAARSHVSGKAVANMSLGGPANSSVDRAVQSLINDGVTVAVAAGNSNANACNSSPARVSAALTVGATDTTDTRAGFSNYGSCLDLFAPGVNIDSTWNTGDTATLSGTSMATPHVAGAAAVVLSTSAATLTPATVASRMTSTASAVVSARGAGSPNRLLYLVPQ